MATRLVYEPLNDAKNEIRLLYPARHRELEAEQESTESDNYVIQLEMKKVSLDDFNTEARAFLDSRGQSFYRGVDYAAFIKDHSIPPEFGRWSWGDFTALSYVWGDGTNSCDIKVNGATVSVRRNLWDYLVADLKEHFTVDFGSGEIGWVGNERLGLWVDSICINQEDIEEKSAQVKHMWRIYEQAILVVGWLGKATDSTHSAVNLLEDAAVWGYNKSEGIFLRDIKSNSDAYQPGTWIALQELVNLQYWSRLWIVQEIVLSFELLAMRWGDKAIMWSQMTDGISVLIEDADAFYSTWERQQRKSHDVTGLEDHSGRNNGVDIFDRLHRLLLLRTISDTRSGRVKLPTQIQIIRIVRDSDQYDDRDKVYGIFNLIAPQISAHIQPNYNLSVEQVYIDFTKAVIRATNSLDIICQARTVRPQSLTFRKRYREEYLQIFQEKLLNEFGEEMLEKWGEEASEIKDKVLEYCGKIAQYQPLPSWVLDLREKTRKKIELTSVLRPYNTCNPSVATIEFIDKILCAKGFKIDEVDGLGPTCSHELSCENNCVIQPVHKNSPYSSEASKKNALWHTLSAGRDVSLEAITAAYEGILQIPWIDWESVAESDRCELFGTNFHGFHKYRLSSASLLLGGRTLKSYFPPKNEQKIREQMEHPELKKQIRRVQSVWHCRKLMITAKGHFGMAAELAQQGDHICILFGCSTPVIMRPNLYDSTYTMVGETYVHGFMEREGMKGLERGRYKAKTFLIV